MPFENFREKYLKDHTAIFLEGAHALNFILGFDNNGYFEPIVQQDTAGQNSELSKVKPAKIKGFKVHFYYDLYF